ncbi:MAG TPA: winged helix-turn-helix domain-containing protein [Vicinamibacterales bacterium]|nr:winged helix-turn-helix domain-containing protein [Vicinamibacterales bacterium]
MASARQVAFGSFRLDLTKRRLWRDGRIVPLTPKVFDTLAVLVLHRDQVVEKDELMKLVWPGSFVAEDNLTHNISVLRKALGDFSDPPEFILTISRRGYRFIASVTELRADSGEASAAPDTGDALEPKAKSSLGRWMGIFAAISLLAGLAILARAVLLAPAAPSALGPIRFVVNAPKGTTLVTGAVLSPDARHLAFVAADRSGTRCLWASDLDSAESRVVPLTEGASRPFWSPDGQRIGFFADGKLKKVGLGGDPPQTIASVGADVAGGSWSTNGLILFAERLSALYSVSAEGGTVTSVTRLDPSAQERRHRWPQFLPDGRHFLYFVVSASPDHSGTYVGSLDSAERGARLLDGTSSPAIYAQPGYLLYVHDRMLFAQPFDLTRLQLTGRPVAIVANVSPPRISDGAVLSAAAGGVLTFGGNGNAEHLVWFSRSGQSLGAIDTPTVLRNPTFSPDQRQLLGQSDEADRAGVWVVDLERGASTRIAADGAVPLWSPDGAHIAFTSGRTTGVDDIFVRPTAGRSEDSLLLRTMDTKHVHSWSLDGRYIVYVSTSPRQKLDLWLLPMFGDRQPIPFLQTPFNQKQGQVSPDGRWMAYASDESGAWEVYIQSFPVPGGKRTVSVGGGTEPQWRRDGRELFYLAADDTLMAVDVKPGETWQAGRPNALFRPRLSRTEVPRNHYAVAADGQRFVIDSVSDGDNQEPMTVLVNWPAALKR